MNRKGTVNGEVKQSSPKKQDNNEEDVSEQQEESENMSNNSSSDNHNNGDDMAHHKLPVKGDKSCNDNSDDKSEDGDNNDDRNSTAQHISSGMGEKQKCSIILLYNLPTYLTLPILTLCFFSIYFKIIIF